MADRRTAAAEWDVVVIGAGIIGCAVAHAVAHRGAKTVVLEARAVAGGATQASAGVLAPFIEAPSDGPLHASRVTPGLRSNIAAAARSKSRTTATPPST